MRMLICDALLSAKRTAEVHHAHSDGLVSARVVPPGATRSIAETGRAPRWASDPAPSVALWAEHSPDTASLWPHRFEAMYSVRDSACMQIFTASVWHQSLHHAELMHLNVPLAVACAVPASCAL